MKDRNLQAATAANDSFTQIGAYAVNESNDVDKETAIAKMVARALARHSLTKTVVLLTAEHYQADACKKTFSQIEMIGQKYGVSLVAPSDIEDWITKLASLSQKPLVLIDTMEMVQRDHCNVPRIEKLDAAGMECLLLLNTISSANTLNEVARIFDRQQVAGCIVAKLDETANPN